MDCRRIFWGWRGFELRPRDRMANRFHAAEIFGDCGQIRIR
jgi:hypothetical protein